MLGKDPGLQLRRARAAAMAGEPDRALEALERAAALGFGVEAATDPAFAPLRSLARFEALLSRISENAKPVARSRAAFTIDQPDLIPEGTAWDPIGATLFVSSLAKSKIVAVDAAGKARDFVTPGQDGLWQVLGMKVDPSRRSLWACSAEGDAPEGNPARRSALFRFAISGGRLEKRYASPSGGAHLFNDLVVTRAGDVYLTDSEEGSVYRLRAQADALELFEPPGSLVYPNGIALSDDEGLLFVAHAAGVMAYAPRDGKRFALPAPENVTLVGIDGLYFHRGWLIAVQNGTEPPRVAAFRLGPKRDSVTDSRVLERGNPAFEDPTTGAIAGETFFYIANTQLSSLRPGGVIADPGKRKPVQILKMDLP